MTSGADSELASQVFMTLLALYVVEQYFNQTVDEAATGFVERFNGSLRDRTRLNCVRLWDLYWVEDLPQLVKTYETSRHITGGATPETLWSPRFVSHSRVIHHGRFCLKDEDDLFYQGYCLITRLEPKL